MHINTFHLFWKPISLACSSAVSVLKVNHTTFYWVLRYAVRCWSPKRPWPCLIFDSFTRYKRPWFSSPFHSKRAGSRSDRLLRATRAKTATTKWLAAVDSVWTLFVLNETDFSFVSLVCSRVSPESSSNFVDEEDDAFAGVSCHLESAELWAKFHQLGTEMIITKTGRYEQTL